MLNLPGLQVLKSLDAGGFGAVHLARRRSDQMLVAVKVPHLPNADHVRRFYREAKILHKQMDVNKHL